jgi:ABC-type uncharacterized transport system substrate-binding protein
MGFRQLFLCVFAAFLAVATPVFSQSEVVVVTSDGASTLLDFAVAVQTKLSARYSVEVLSVSEDDFGRLSDMVATYSPTVVVAIGTKVAMALSRDLSPTLPLIYSLVLDPSVLHSRLQMVGRSLIIPMETRLSILRRLFPHIYRVGVLAGPDEDIRALQRQFSLISKKSGHQVFVESVGNQEDLQKSLTQLFDDRVEIVMSTPKARIYTGSDIRYLLLSLDRYRIPYVGLSQAYLGMGAMLSMDADMDHEVDKTVALVDQALSQGHLTHVPKTAFLDKVTYTLNAKVIRQFRFRLTTEALDGAKELRE